MKKYQLSNLADNEVVGIYNTKSEAISVMNDLINGINYTNNETEDDGLSPFDFALDTVEDDSIEVEEFKSAVKYLMPKNEDTFYSNTEDVSTLLKEVNPHHIKALIALNRLFTIAEAWNKKCDFTPDFSNEKQNKWFPFFKYNKAYGCFMVSSLRLANLDMSASIGARLCFPTEDVAEQFGKRFIDLYNQVFALDSVK